MKHISRTLDRELKKGSAELLILSLVEARARHGYEISKLIESRSGGRVRFKVASLYPLLYRLTATGRQVLAAQRDNWREFVEAIRRITGDEHA